LTESYRPDDLTALAEYLSSKIIEESLICANSFDKLIEEFDDIQPLSNGIYCTLILEHIYLFLHLGHRWSFETHGSADSDKFNQQMQNGIEKIVELIRTDDRKESIKRLRNDQFVIDAKICNLRNLEYSKFLMLVPDSDEDPGTEGKLLWEFAARISELISGHNKDARIILPCVDWTIESLNNMLIRKSLQHLKES